MSPSARVDARLRRSSQERRTQEQRSAEMRVRLLDATVECLVEYGYAGTTTPRVADKAGVTRGAQVHHFGSKNDLVLAAVKHLAAKRAETIVRDVGDITASVDPVATILDVLWDVHSGPIFVATVELWVAARTDPTLRAEVARFESIVIGSLLSALGAAAPEQIHKPLLDFLYTAMDALRGILISSFVDADSDRALRRWKRASANLRRIAEPALAEWRRSAKSEAHAVVAADQLE